jgi:hypothetical protein
MQGKSWWYLNRAGNFLQHADRDPDAILEDVDEGINDPAIFFAIAYYADSSEELEAGPAEVFRCSLKESTSG